MCVLMMIWHFRISEWTGSKCCVNSGTKSVTLFGNFRLKTVPFFHSFYNIHRVHESLCFSSPNWHRCPPPFSDHGAPGALKRMHPSDAPACKPANVFHTNGRAALQKRNSASMPLTEDHSQPASLGGYSCSISLADCSPPSSQCPTAVNAQS